MIKYIEWDEEKLQQWFKDKFRKRGLDICEYVFLTKFIREIEPEIVIDVGTFLGASGYILGTSSPKLKKLYALEHHHGSTYSGPYKGLVKTEDYGKYLPEYAIFKTIGYEIDLEPILKEHEGGDVFIFFDSGKNPMRIFHQVQMCYQYKIRYIAFHDTKTPQVRRGIKRVKELGLYRIHSECLDAPDEGKKGVTILELC